MCVHHQDSRGVGSKQWGGGGGGGGVICHLENSQNMSALLPFDAMWLYSAKAFLGGYPRGSTSIKRYVHLHAGLLMSDLGLQL